MTTPDRFERNLPVLFDELAAARTPDYFDDFLRRSARTRQRPGWTFPERWIPMSAITSRAATTPRPSWRVIGLVALLLIALALGAVFLAGSQKRLPAPFGVAGNGLIAYVDSAGAINVGEPATGASNLIVAGPGNQRPVFSPDGTHLAFLSARAAVGGFDLTVVRVDGTGRRVISTDPLADVGYLSWSPDSKSVVVTVPPGTLELFDANRAAEPRIVTKGLTTDYFGGYSAYHGQPAAFFRPPDGKQIMYVGWNGTQDGLTVMNSDGSNVRSLIDHTRTDITYSSLASAQWSPDGTMIAFTSQTSTIDDDRQAFVMNADGTGLRPLRRRELQLPPDTLVTEGVPSWSPNGKSIAIQLWINTARPITVINVEDGIETEVGDLSMNGYNGWMWSPDGTSILQIPDLASIGQATANRVVIVDVPSGRAHETTWTTGAASAWQRVAP